MTITVKKQCAKNAQCTFTPRVGQTVTAMTPFGRYRCVVIRVLGPGFEHPVLVEVAECALDLAAREGRMVNGVYLPYWCWVALEDVEESE